MCPASHEMAASAADVSAEAKPRRAPGFHYKPSLRNHTEEAIRHVDTLAAAVLAWVQEKRPAKVIDVPSGQIDHEEMRAQLAQSLSATVEWEGAAVGAQLAQAWKWPVDQPLINLIHSWSCGLHRAKYEAWIADRANRRARRARHTA